MLRFALGTWPQHSRADALNQETGYTYNSYGQATRISGLTTTDVYGTSC